MDGNAVIAIIIVILILCLAMAGYIIWSIQHRRAFFGDEKEGGDEEAA